MKKKEKETVKKRAFSPLAWDCQEWNSVSTTKIYFNEIGLAKLLGIAKGKKLADKRKLRKQDWEKQKAQILAKRLKLNRKTSQAFHFGQF